MTDLERFYRSLHDRGLNQEKLAALAQTGRAHLCEVLNNKPQHGHRTRQRLFPHLTSEEVRLLGWTTEFNRWRKVQSEKNALLVASSTRNFVPI